MNKDQSLLQEAYKKVQNPRSEWDKWLSELKHEVHEDGSITVYGSVDLSSHKLTEIPFKFREVTGYFDCDDNPHLTSLEGSPRIVGGDFHCGLNSSIVTLAGGPQKVCGDFYCDNNPQITSLRGMQTEIGGHFFCDNNFNLTSLEGAPERIGGTFYCKNNPKLKSPRGLPKAETYLTDFTDKEIERELYKRDLDSEMDPETKDVFGDLLDDL